ncbi:MAG TPA: cob(I)yrinic acid a,c-diamide adenosyltransferase [Bacteroidales bacterium]|nr:cob(I)yrinic acid a,c-diamide adenosyltransferase [Bacteroidales bacterium]
MKIYTLTGDDGSTSLSGGRRVPKQSLRVEAYGSVEELTSWMGLLRDVIPEPRIKELILSIQDNLMKCEAVLSSGDKDRFVIIPPEEDCLKILETTIDEMQNELPLMKNFIIPGGDKTVSFCHIARTVCRRAERSVLRLKSEEFVPDIINKYLNRLSDYLFVLARFVAYNADVQEHRWPLE